MCNSYQTVEDIRSLGFSDEYVVSEIVDQMTDFQREEFFKFLREQYYMEDPDEVIYDLDEFYYEAQVTASDVLDSMSVYFTPNEFNAYYLDLLDETE